MGNRVLSREALAAREIGQTDIHKSLSVVLTLIFICTVFFVPVRQVIIDRSEKSNVVFFQKQSSGAGDSLTGKINRTNKAFLKTLHDLESGIEENSFLRKVFLPPLQHFFLKYLGQGNEKAVSGRDGWLFYRPGLDYLIGQPFLEAAQLEKRVEAHDIWEQPVHPDPVSAIVDFKEQLQQRGIELIVVPIPVKAAMQPGKISARPVTGDLVNRSWLKLQKRLTENGVRLFDVRPILHKYATDGKDVFLARDTHWRPESMRAVAEELAKYCKALFPDMDENDNLQSRLLQIKGQGDIAKMLTLPENMQMYADQEVEIEQVINKQGEFWQPDRMADLLLLGDSFTNIYSRSSLGWDAGAGFAEQLSYLLQHPVDLLARNDSGAYVTREMLAVELQRGRDRLAGKKLVIWQFSERELAFGDWKPIALHLGEPEESGFFVASFEEEITVSGLVAEISRSPRPGSVPYRDNLVTLHLVDLKDKGKKMAEDQALVYGWGMKDNQLTGFSDARVGDIVTVRLSSWEKIETEYGSYRRSPLDDEMMELELPNWGKLIDE